MTSSPATVTDEDTGQTIVPIVDVEPGSTGVTLSNLVVDGSGLSSSFSGCGDNFVGVLYQEASGTISASTVRNVELSSGLGGCQDGLAIFVQSGSGTANVAIQQNTVTNYDKNGITCVDAGTVCNIDQNTITGAGPTSTIGAQNGIQVGPGAAGTIDNTNASGDDWTGAVNPVEPQADYAAGILLYGAGGKTTVDHSDLGNDQIGLEIVDSNAHVDHSTITETGSGIPGSVGLFDVPCDYYCSGIGLSPGNVTLSLDHTQVSFAGTPAGSYGIWIGDSWTGSGGSGGTVTYHVDHSQITGATYPTAYGPRAAAG